MAGGGAHPTSPVALSRRVEFHCARTRHGRDDTELCASTCRKNEDNCSGHIARDDFVGIITHFKVRRFLRGSGSGGSGAFGPGHRPNMPLDASEAEWYKGSLVNASPSDATDLDGKHRSTDYSRTSGAIVSYLEFKSLVTIRS